MVLLTYLSEQSDSLKIECKDIERQTEREREREREREPASTPKTETAGYSETLVGFFQIARHHFPVDCIVTTHHKDSLFSMR